MGTVFLLAAAFFVCSTFISMRSVFADPVAPANTLPQRNGRTSPRATASGRATVARTATSRATTRTPGATRATSARGNAANRTVTSRGNSATGRTVNAVPSRGVTARNQAVSNARSNRAVRARTATNNSASRVSATGSMMAGMRASTSTSYSYLASSLYTGSYSNIIDSTTGLISADAYSNCLESYYTCMDEICTARSDTKGRCSCAGRATNFLTAETALEKANEELIRLSGQLSLLIATKGKGDDLAAAFSLTDAEKVMNCVSYKENVQSGKMSASDWYDEHPTVNSNGAKVTSGMPDYCEGGKNDFGFDIKDIDGSSSDILAQLKAWADAKDLAKEYTTTDNNNLLSKYTTVSGVVDGLAGITTNSDEEEASLDSLANKWGYDLFQYAHNNVCGRVLDSCFNGIYEACGTPKSITEGDTTVSVKCANGATSNCPFNYNSYISVKKNGDTSTGEVVLSDRSTAASGSVSSSASCFGYTSTTTTTSRGTTTTSTDPYASLRGPVADARRSIMQKYLLDANAACDTYGAALKQTAQNINYQKIAAEQALQQKRLEFKQEIEANVLADATTAIDNFNECISEIWDCYDEYSTEDSKWTTARIKAYCSQISQVPHCYEPMICSPVQTQLIAVIDKADSSQCVYSNDHNENTCRNVVTIGEILYGVGKTDGSAALDNWTGVGKITVNSAAVREQCLARTLGCDSTTAGVACLRTWKKGDNDSYSDANDAEGVISRTGTSTDGLESCSNEVLSALNAATGHVKNGGCEIDTCLSDFELVNRSCQRKSCSPSTLSASHATEGHMYNGSCVIEDCESDYTLNNGRCYVNACDEDVLAALSAVSGHMEGGLCKVDTCEDDFRLVDGECQRKNCSATALSSRHATAGQIYDGECRIETCEDGYELSGNTCNQIGD